MAKSNVLDKFKIDKKGKVRIGKHYPKLSGKVIDLSSITMADAEYLSGLNFPYITVKK